MESVTLSLECSVFPAAWAIAGASELVNETSTISATSVENRRFIDSLGNLQFLRYDIAGLFVPDTWGKYCPALAGVPRLLVERKQIESLYSSRLGRLFDGSA